MLTFNKRNAVAWSRLGLRGAFGGIGIMAACEEEDNIYVVSADTSGLLGLERFKTKYPGRFVNAGIAEQNMIGISAGLASEGFCVFASTYASFITARAYEFIRQNLGYLKYNVKVIGCASGMVTGTSGVSHWSVDDIALMREIPNMTVISPADGMEAVKAALAVAKINGPAYVRLCGGTTCPILYEQDYDFQIGKAIAMREGTDVAMIATGLMVKDALDAAERLAEKRISCAVYNMHTIKPLDTELLEEIYRKFKLIVTIEEHSVIGGLGGAVAEHKAMYGNSPRQLFLGVTDEYKMTGSRPFILAQYGLTAEGIAERTAKALYDQSGK